LIISEEEIHKFIQLTNSRMDLIFPDTKKVATAGVTDNTMRGKLIKIQNQVLEWRELVKVTCSSSYL
jgi:hypothetical protein